MDAARPATEAPEAPAEKGAAPVSPPKKNKRAEAGVDTEAAEEEASVEESVADEAAPPAPGESETHEGASAMTQLEAEMDAFEIFTDAGELSCGSAKPHLEAICAIAARICGDGDNLLKKDSDCQRAQESCTSAKKRFSDKCGN